MTEEKIREIIRDELSQLIMSDRYVFHKLIQILDGRNIQIGQTTGTKIGNSDTAKVSVYSATPVVRQDHIANATGGTTVDSQARAVQNLILTALETFGILKSS